MAPPVSTLFAVRSGVTAPPPRQPPRVQRGFGSYCFRAICHLHAADGTLLGTVTGYDRAVTVGCAAEGYCTREMARRRGAQGGRCGDAEVVLLSGGVKECSGQFFFALADGSDGGATRLL